MVLEEQTGGTEIALTDIYWYAYPYESDEVAATGNGNWRKVILVGKPDHGSE